MCAWIVTRISQQVRIVPCPLLRHGRRWASVTRRALFLAVLLTGPALLGTGCQNLTLGGEAYVYQPEPTDPPPRSLAILPTTDAARRPDIAEIIRSALFTETSALAVQNVELHQVDARLAQLAARLNLPPDQLPVEMLAHPSVADLVLFSHLEDVSRLWLVVYARVKLKMHLTLVDTRTRRVLYRNQFTIVDRLGGPTLTLGGTVEHLMVGLFNLRPAALQATLIQSAREIVQTLPPLRVDRAFTDALRIRDVRVTLPSRVLRADQTIHVQMVATPGANARFSIGRPDAPLPMQEIATGIYAGSYTVAPGDDTPYAIVEVHLEAPDGSESLVYPAADTPFAIDTVPPNVARVVRWWRAEPGTQGIYLELGMQDEGAERPARYRVLRRQTYPPSSGDFTEIGAAESPIFHDATAARGFEYEYRVVAEDEARNAAPPGHTTRVLFQ